jgi:threonine aldolase
MAALCGQPAAAFVVSGTMANQLALAVLCSQHGGGPSQGILADASSHVVNFEVGGLALLARAMVQPVVPSNGVYLRVEDVRRHAKISKNEEESPLPVEICPTSVVSLENTAHGNVVPVGELRAIKEWADANGVLVHIDGARIWHAVVAGEASSYSSSPPSLSQPSSHASSIAQPQAQPQPQSQTRNRYQTQGSQSQNQPQNGDRKDQHRNHNQNGTRQGEQMKQEQSKEEEIKNLKEITSLAKTTTLSLSKILSAPVGAVIVGPTQTIQQIKRLRQSIGGGVRKVGPLAAAAWEGVVENFGSFAFTGTDTFTDTFMDTGIDTDGDTGTGTGTGTGSLIHRVHEMAARVARMWVCRGGRLVRPVETNMVWLDLEISLSGDLGGGLDTDSGSGSDMGSELGFGEGLKKGGLVDKITESEMREMALERGILVSPPRIVLHHQICEEALLALEEVFEDVLVRRRRMGILSGGNGSSKGCVQRV